MEAPRAYACRLILGLCHAYTCKQILGIDTWPMSLAPMIGKSVWLAGKEKPRQGKDPCRASLAENLLPRKGNLQAACDMCDIPQDMCRF